MSYIHQRNVKHWSVDDNDNVLLADFWFIKRSNQDAQRTSFFEINALPLIVFYLSLCTNRPHLICWKVFFMVILKMHGGWLMTTTLKREKNYKEVGRHFCL